MMSEHQHHVDERRDVDVALDALAAYVHRHGGFPGASREGLAPFLDEEVDGCGGRVVHVDLDRPPPGW
jgi:hypothetical protein